MILKLNDENVAVPFREENSINLSMDFTQDIQSPQFTGNTLSLATSNRDYFLNWLQNQGAFQGIPIKAYIAGNTTIDMMSNLDFQILDTSISLGIQPRFDTQNFKRRANGMSFRTVDFNNSDFINIPYVVVPENKGVDLILLSISTFSITNALIDATKDLVEATATLISGVGGPAGAALEFAATLVKFTATAAAAYQLGTQLKNVIFPTVHNHLGIRLHKLVEKCCEQLGYTLQSELLNVKIKNWTLLPRSQRPTVKNIIVEAFNTKVAETYGYPVEGDVFSDFGTLLDWLRRVTNSQIKIIGSTVIIESEDYFINNASVDLEEFLAEQDIQENKYSYNFGTKWRRKTISYGIDQSDFYSQSQLKRVNYEVAASPIGLTSPELDLMEGVENIEMGLALGYRKDELSFVEKTAKGVLSFIDSVVNFFGANSNLAGLIESRIGVLQISQEYYSMTKLLWVDDSGKQPEDYREIIGAQFIYNNFHKSLDVKNGFRETATITMRLTEEIFVTLISNNYCTMGGKTIEILNIDFNTSYGEDGGGGYATLDIKRPANIDPRVQITVVNDGDAQ